jgi:K+:H+ antiporter
MGHVPLLDELAVIAALAVVVTVVLARLRMPTVAGLLVAGAIAGPHGAGLARSVDAIEVLAEVGVVLLLFTIGLEFSLARLRDIFRQVVLGGVIQVALTTAVIAILALGFGEPLGRAVFWGFVFSMSSTAIVLRALGERRELEAPHGRFIVGALIFQDLCVVPMVLIVPMLAGSRPGAALDILRAMGTAAIVVVGTLLVARVVVPRILGWVDASRSRETFLLAMLTICIGTAWLTSLAGLSLALGAFLGGIVVADTEYGHRALGDMLPLRDAFVSIFFVSLGMLFDVRIVLEQPILVAILLGGFIAAKGSLGTLSALAMGFPARVAWLAGVGLAQFGEFGFVLVRLGESSGVVDAAATRPLLAAGIVSMFLTPLMVRVAPHFTAGERLLAPLERRIGVRSVDDADTDADQQGHPLRDHVIVVGLGLAGRSVAAALDACAQRFIALELDAQIVRSARADGIPIYYADATSEEALRHAHIEKSRLLVLLIDDPNAAERVVATVRRVAPALPVLMRTRRLRERDYLHSIGARDVVAEEVEGAVEILVRMLRSLAIPRNVIEERIREMRLETASSDRRQTIPRPQLADITALSVLKIEDVLVHPGSPAAGASPASLCLRTRTGALVVAIRRGDLLLENPDPHAPFEPADIVYLVGRSEAIQSALALF